MKDKLNRNNPAARAAAMRGDWENAVIAATPGSIEKQEAEAQQGLVRSTKLPKEGTEGTNRATLERLGFVFGKEIDDLFVACQLPQGWSIKPSDHSMWSFVYDDQGRKRMSIFYKGAFYDRRAFASMEAIT
jgi:hypothetical protein